MRLCIRTDVVEAVFRIFQLLRQKLDVLLYANEKSRSFFNEEHRSQQSPASMYSPLVAGSPHLCTATSICIGCIIPQAVKRAGRHANNMRRWLEYTVSLILLQFNHRLGWWMSVKRFYNLAQKNNLLYTFYRQYPWRFVGHACSTVQRFWHHFVNLCLSRRVEKFTRREGQKQCGVMRLVTVVWWMRPMTPTKFQPIGITSALTRVGRRKQIAFRCFIDSLLGVSIFSNRNTSFCRISDWAKTMLVIPVCKSKSQHSISL